MHGKLKFEGDLYQNLYQDPFQHAQRLKNKNELFELLNMQVNYHLILVNSSTSSLLQPWVQPENANMSISYLRWRTRNGPFFLSSRITFLPNSSIWEVNLRALKLTLQRSFWISGGRPLLASRASVLFKWTTLYFRIKGKTCKNKYAI
jgi:hypothetical protein